MCECALQVKVFVYNYKPSLFKSSHPHDNFCAFFAPATSQSSSAITKTSGDACKNNNSNHRWWWWWWRARTFTLSCGIFGLGTPGTLPSSVMPRPCSQNYCKKTTQRRESPIDLYIIKTMEILPTDPTIVE